MAEADFDWKSFVCDRFSADSGAERWRAIYDEPITDVEDHFFRERRSFAVDYALKECREDALILDLGCGAAPFSTPLRAAGRRVIPLDYSPDMLALARQRLTEAKLDAHPLIRGDSESLPFADAQFDFTACLGVISYLPDYTGVLREIFRTLRPGARAIITTRNRRNPLLWDPLRTAKALLNGSEVHRNSRSPGRLLDPEDVEADLVAAGFEIDGFTGIGFGPLRFRGRRVLGTDASVRLSDAIAYIGSRTGWRWVYRNGADVNLWICRRP
jgi:SAM-dependent methyltransferase